MGHGLGLAGRGDTEDGRVISGGIDMSGSSTREHWSGSFGFIMAAAGSAIGLGNIWKFPYITGENGGGAFVLVYLLCIAVIGVPVMICEITLGRHTQRNPVGAFSMLNPPISRLAHFIGLCMVLLGVFLAAFKAWGWSAVTLGLGVVIFRYGWKVVGGMGVVAGFCILSFYSVVAGWTIGYVWKAVSGRLAFASVEAAQAHFEVFTVNPYAAVGADRGGRVGIDWGVYGVPETYVVADGRIAFKHVGPLSADSIATVLRPEIDKALAAAGPAQAAP